MTSGAFSRFPHEEFGIHPYSPVQALIPSYRPNESPAWVLLASFATITSTIVVASVVLAKSFNPRVNSLFAICWFTLCAFLHCTFEAYFLVYNDRLAGMQSIYAQLWKEYALCDSRYLTRDPFLLSIEALTVAITGPLCVATVVSIVRNSSMRHPLQITICACHLYGVVLYYASSFVEQYLYGASYSRPEPIYSCVYFVGLNIPWVIVPLFLLTDSIKTFYDLTGVLQSVEHALANAHDLMLAKNRLKAKKSKEVKSHRLSSAKPTARPSAP